MRKQTRQPSVRRCRYKEDMSLVNNAAGTQMVAEIETPEATGMKRRERRSKVQVLFYMNESVVTELKHRAVDKKKTFSQLAEDFIIAGLRSDQTLRTS